LKDDGVHAVCEWHVSHVVGKPADAWGGFVVAVYFVW
jgi:hypothetical protein